MTLSTKRHLGMLSIATQKIWHSSYLYYLQNIHVFHGRVCHLICAPGLLLFDYFDKTYCFRLQHMEHIPKIKIELHGKGLDYNDIK